MRAYHAVAIVAIILIGFGSKLFFFTPSTVEADARPVVSVRMDVSQMQQNIKNLPVQEFHDRSLEFPVLLGSD